MAVKTVGRWEREIPIPSDKLGLLTKLGFDAQYVVTGERCSVSSSKVAALSAEEALLLERYRQSPTALRDAALRVLLGDSSRQPSVRKFKEVGQYIEGSVDQTGLNLNVGGSSKRKK
ncbi:hypothetical protein D9M70_463840 [compost metagenome]